MSDSETYYVRSTKFCLFYMYVYLFYTFIRLMLLRLCSQHYFILVMNPVTFYNNNNNNNNNNKQDKQAWERVVALCLRWLSHSDPLYGL